MRLTGPPPSLEWAPGPRETLHWLPDTDGYSNNRADRQTDACHQLILSLKSPINDRRGKIKTGEVMAVDIHAKLNSNYEAGCCVTHHISQQQCIIVLLKPRSECDHLIERQSGRRAIETREVDQ